MASIGDLEIPGTVAFAILIALKSSSSTKLRIPAGFLPPAPKSLSSEVDAAMLPAICGNCFRLLGRIEGGKLAYSCNGCKSQPSLYFTRIHGLGAVLGSWAKDAVACAVLAEHLELNPYAKPVNARLPDWEPEPIEPLREHTQPQATKLTQKELLTVVPDDL